VLSQLRPGLVALSVVASLLDRAAPAAASVVVAPRERSWALAAETTPIAMAAGWAVTFGYLSLVRHLSGGSHAEDLGFTDQVLWNSLHGHLFHMSIYAGAASWNTELDLSSMPRPDSLLAFHFEPMLLGLLPLYGLGGINLLLALQALGVALGAVPAFRIGTHVSGSRLAGLAVATAYLLSPLGQWAVLADFHTSVLAAPLLVFVVERFVVARNELHAFALAAVAVTAREDVAAVVAVLGLSLLLHRGTRRLGTALTVLGGVSTAVALAVIHTYSGGVSPFEVRYGPSLADPMAALARSGVIGYLGTLLLSGAWLGVFAPWALLPALPSLALNALSSSPWMASGQAHYSALVLPFVTVGACFALARLRHWPGVLRGASLALFASSLVSYALAGSGPLAANYAPATVTEHAMTAASLAASLPSDAAVSASSSLVPRVSERARAYVFPAVLDADYVFLDLHSSPAPTSAGDVYLRTQALLASGEWHVAHNADGLLLLSRAAPSALSASRGDPSAPDTAAVPSALSPVRGNPSAPEASLAPSALSATRGNPSSPDTVPAPSALSAGRGNPSAPETSPEPSAIAARDDPSAPEASLAPSALSATRDNPSAAAVPSALSASRGDPATAPAPGAQSAPRGTTPAPGVAPAVNAISPSPADPTSPAPGAQSAARVQALPADSPSPPEATLAQREEPSLPTSSASLPREEISSAADHSTPRALRQSPRLLSASLIPSPEAAIDTDGPHWILRTTWQTQQPLPSGTRPEFQITLTTGNILTRWDIADMWWNPPDRWPVDQPITIDVPDIPHNTFESWSATWSQR
jgi:uncharacterized membrane protein